LNPQSISPVSRTPRSPRSSLCQTLLVTLALLSLPCSAWAQQVAISGQVKFADGSGVSLASITARPTSSGGWLNTTADSSGNYALYLPPGTYDIIVQFSNPGFYGSQRVVSARSITTTTQLNLTLSDIVLSGRILNSGGQTVAGARLSGYSYTSEGMNDLYVTAGADGRFQVRMLPGTYTGMRLYPPSSGTYAITVLPDATFSVSTSRDYVLINGVNLSGQVKFADGKSVSQASITLEPTSAGATQNTTADSSGNYSMYVAPGTYDIIVQFSVPGFYGSQRVVLARSITTTTLLNLTLSDIVLSGRILNSSGLPVIGARLSGYSYSSEGMNDLYATSEADGRFQVHMLPGTYTGMRIYPPSGTAYAITVLPDATFSVSTSRDYVLANPASLGGQVRFADGSGVSLASISLEPTSGGASQSTTADSSGNYMMYVAPGTYDIVVRFSNPGFYGSQRVVLARSITTTTLLNLTLSDIVLSGRILNSSGQPVAGARLSGYSYSSEGMNDLFATAGADGGFQVRMLPCTYTGMRIYPGSSSGYLETQRPDETFSVSASRDYVIEDLNECLVNNGGCSVNATCTNLPGSRTCACKPGYTGDGITCQPAQGRILINEILANELGSSTAGEFVELINLGATSIDLTGWTISDATAVRHTFPAGAMLASGKSLVVFAAASAIPPGLSNAVASSTGNLNLANSGDTVTVKNAANTVMDTFSYGSSLGALDGVSMNRSPDATEGARFVLHNSLTTLDSSPGKRFNGTAF
jgi:hypothetical protein